MAFLNKCALVLLMAMVVSSSAVPPKDVHSEIEEYLAKSKIELNEKYEQFEAALSDENRWDKVSEAMLAIQNLYIPIYQKLKSYPPETIRSADLRRVIDMWTRYPVETRIEERMIWIKNPMILSEKGSKPTFCDYEDKTKCNLNYVKDVHKKMAKSNDADELLFYWKQWRDKLNEDDVDTLFELVNATKNFAERENELTSDLYYFYAGRDNFYQQVLKLHDEILPIYKQMHAFVRFKLRQKYGEDNVPKTGAIPQHLMDQIFTQAWKGDSINYPYPSMAIPNLTESQVSKGYTGLKQLEVANEFYNSIGMHLPSGFWEEKVKPSSSASCSGTTIGSSDDGFEVEYCPKVDFLTFLREFDNMLNLRYKMKYSHLPPLLDREPCPGFSNALSESVKLSVVLPSYIQSIGLFDASYGGDQFEINRLYRLAIHAVLAMPMHILHDKFWVELSKGLYDRSTINSAYETMLLEYTGVKMPDHGDNYKLIIPYQFFRGISYSKPNTIHIFNEAMGYEFYKALCKKTGLYNPDKSDSYLKDCNFYGHELVGDALNEIMSYGNTKDWWVIVEPLIGKTELSASGILEYFKPLQDWLEAENRRNGEPVGW